MARSGLKSTKILAAGRLSVGEDRYFNHVKTAYENDALRNKRKYFIKLGIYKLNSEYDFSFQLYRGEKPWPQEKKMKPVEAFVENKRLRLKFIDKGCEGELWTWKFKIEDLKKYQEMMKLVKIYGGYRDDMKNKMEEIYVHS